MTRPYTAQAIPSETSAIIIRKVSVKGKNVFVISRMDKTLTVSDKPPVTESGILSLSIHCAIYPSKCEANRIALVSDIMNARIIAKPEEIR